MPRPPRVLLLAPHWPPDQGAAAARLSGLARELQALGHELRVVAPTASYLRPAGSVEEGGAERVAVARRGRGGLANAWHQLRLWRGLRDGARRVLRDFDAEVVLVSSPPPIAALAGLGLPGRDGGRLPVVVDQRDLWPDVGIEAGAFSEASPWAQVLRFVERRLLAGAERITTVTALKVERLGARTNRPVQLVPNGVDAGWLEDAPARREPASGFEVVYAGNLGRAQDAAALVRVVARCARARATIVGDGEERAAVEETKARLGAPVRLEEPQPRERVRELLAGASCAFVTLRSAQLVDAVPSKLLEAMALGVPVLLSAAGESAALVQEAGAGLVAPPGDDEALLAALRQLVEMSPAERLSLGAAGRAFVLERFRREDAAARLSRVLSEAAA